MGAIKARLVKGRADSTRLAEEQVRMRTELAGLDVRRKSAEEALENQIVNIGENDLKTNLSLNEHIILFSNFISHFYTVIIDSPKIIIFFIWIFISF
mgnify:CR=1 FL=1